MVIWDDAHGDATSEVGESELIHAPSRYQSYGWILRTDPAGVSIAAEWLPEGNKYRATMFIPRAMVAEERIVRLSPPRKLRAKKVPA